MPFTVDQVQQLLHPINPSRVLKDGKGHSHVSQQDIIAHLIRVFGFGNFDTEVIEAELVFEAERSPGRYDVCYRAMVRLAVRDPKGQSVCHFENGSTATAQNQSRGDAHDLAYKSAISLSYKRAAIALGDQFGLSLYNKGQMSALVMGTMVGTSKAAGGRDMQEGVAQQVSMGNDEIEADMDALLAEPPSEPPRDVRRPPRNTAPVADDLLSKAQSGKLHALFGELSMDRDMGLAFLTDTLGREVDTSKSLTKREATMAIDALVRLVEPDPA